MAQLTTDTSYIYRVRGFDTVNQTQRFSQTFSFKSQPSSNNPNRNTKVATLADHGIIQLLGFATVDCMVKQRQALGFEMVFVAGDLSYAGLESEVKILNITSDDEFEHIWDLLAIQNQRIAAEIPWMIGVGNHEQFYDWVAVSNRYKMPTTNPSVSSNGNFWYSFNYANSHWISLSYEHDLATGSPQYQFLLSALEAATQNRRMVPWIIVTIHKPLYCSAYGSPGGFADRLEQILIDYDVDLTIAGHMHLYERVHPVLKGLVTVYPTRERMSGK